MKEETSGQAMIAMTIANTVCSSWSILSCLASISKVILRNARRAPSLGATPGAAEGGVRLGPQEAVGRREGPVGLGSTVVPGEPVFDLRGSGWFHIVLVG